MEGYILLGIIIGSVLALLFWVALVIWTYRDIKDRTSDLAMQILSFLLVAGFAPLGLMLYLIMRPRETLDEAYGRSLEEEALLREIGEDSTCPSCRKFSERSFLFCPYCQTRLRNHCLGCGQVLSLSWIACPQCGMSKMAAQAANQQPTAPAAYTGEGLRSESVPSPTQRPPTPDQSPADGGESRTHIGLDCGRPSSTTHPWDSGQTLARAENHTSRAASTGPHPTSSLDATEGPFLQYPAAARVAQVVEHATENRGVGGSTPPPGTTFQNSTRCRTDSEHRHATMGGYQLMGSSSR